MISIDSDDADMDTEDDTCNVNVSVSPSVTCGTAESTTESVLVNCLSNKPIDVLKLRDNTNDTTPGISSQYEVESLQEFTSSVDDYQAVEEIGDKSASTEEIYQNEYQFIDNESDALKISSVVSLSTFKSPDNEILNTGLPQFSNSLDLSDFQSKTKRPKTKLEEHYQKVRDKNKKVKRKSRPEQNNEKFKEHVERDETVIDLDEYEEPVDKKNVDSPHLHANLPHLHAKQSNTAVKLIASKLKQTMNLTKKNSVKKQKGKSKPEKKNKQIVAKMIEILPGVWSEDIGPVESCDQGEQIMSKPSTSSNSSCSTPEIISNQEFHGNMGKANDVSSKVSSWTSILPSAERVKGGSTSETKGGSTLQTKGGATFQTKGGATSQTTARDSNTPIVVQPESNTPPTTVVSQPVSLLQSVSQAAPISLLPSVSKAATKSLLSPQATTINLLPSVPQATPISLLSSVSTPAIISLLPTVSQSATILPSVSNAATISILPNMSQAASINLLPTVPIVNSSIQQVNPVGMFNSQAPLCSVNQPQVNILNTQLLQDQNPIPVHYGPVQLIQQQDKVYLQVPTTNINTNTESTNNILGTNIPNNGKNNKKTSNYKLMNSLERDEYSETGVKVSKVCKILNNSLNSAEDVSETLESDDPDVIEVTDNSSDSGKNVNEASVYNNLDVIEIVPEEENDVSNQLEDQRVKKQMLVYNLTSNGQNQGSKVVEYETMPSTGQKERFILPKSLTWDPKRNMQNKEKYMKRNLGKRSYTFRNNNLKERVDRRTLNGTKRNTNPDTTGSSDIPQGPVTLSGVVSPQEIEGNYL